MNRKQKKQWERDFLERYQDDHGDLRPPWVEFPTYTQGTIGWRMGSGEAFLMGWFPFVKALKGGSKGRLAYLRRHPAAPVNRAPTVHFVLGRNPKKKPDHDQLFELGLIASDIAYATWLSQQDGVMWPWEYSKSPELAARYQTRELWFWSRQVSALRDEDTLQIPTVPAEWNGISSALLTGEFQSSSADSGLLILAKMLAAGTVQGPWVLGHAVSSSVGSFEMGMSFGDAYHLWMLSAFDDRPQADRFIGAEIPDDWRAWVEERPILKFFH